MLACQDVKCSGNWMWAAKLPGEGAALVDACQAMCDIMKQLGVAVDGGKDSLSMAARTGSEVVKAPGETAVLDLSFLVSVLVYPWTKLYHTELVLQPTVITIIQSWIVLMQALETQMVR